MDKKKAKMKMIVLVVVGVLLILAGPVFGWMSSAWAWVLAIVSFVAAVAVKFMAKDGGGPRPNVPPTPPPGGVT